MTDPHPHAQLLAYRFAPAARFEGQFVGALERLETGGALRVLDVLFVRRDPDTGELDAVAAGGGAGGLVAPLIDFRLDPGRRGAATEAALDGERGAVARDLGSRLEPGEAMAVVLVEHVWVRTLDDAAARTGGTHVESRLVGASRLAELA